MRLCSTNWYSARLHPSADPQVLHRDGHGADAGNTRGVAAQVRQHLLQRRPFAARLELDEHTSVVERVAADDGCHIGDMRGLAVRVGDLLLQGDHRLEGDILTRLGRSWPMSSCGNRPLGVTMSSQAVPASVTKKTISIHGLWRRLVCSVRS